MIELALPPQTITRLSQYVGALRDDAGMLRTEHWALYGAQNQLLFPPDGARLRFKGGAGFDGFYELNFTPGNALEWARQKWTLWRNRGARRLFNRAFLATADGPLDLDAVTRRLRGPLTPHKPLAAYYFNLIAPYLPARPQCNYLEIGAGSGYLAALVHGARGCRTVIIDLPEIIPYSFLYLHQLFPQAAFQLPNEARDAGAISRSASFVFLTPDQGGLLADRSIDLAVNTASFGEMLPAQIAAYFALLRRVMNEDGLFFTCNRVEKWMSAPAAGTDANEPGQEIAVRFADYPWRAGDRDVFFGPSRFHAVIQPESPVMQRLCHLAPQ